MSELFKARVSALEANRTTPRRPRSSLHGGRRGIAPILLGVIIVVVAVVVVVGGLFAAGVFTPKNNGSSTPTYSVTFSESGLAPGGSWTVSLSGSSQTSSSSTIAFSMANGTYSFTASATGYTASPASGSVTVKGAAQSVSIAFTASAVTKYSVTFTETGLPSGTYWLVTLNGTSQTSTQSSITFLEPNGTYSYTVLNNTELAIVTPENGSLNVQGAPVSIAVAISFAPLTLSFGETGLPAGTVWSVSVNGTVYTATVSSAGALHTPIGPIENWIIVHVAWTVATNQGSGVRDWWDAATNCVFGFVVGPVAGFFPSPSSGVLSVKMTNQPENVTQAITFTPVTTYEVTFTETGLSPGTYWLVTLNGTSQTSTQSSITFLEPNGTYSYTILNNTTRMVKVTPESGSITVNGAAVTQAITITLVPGVITFTETGLPPGTNWAVVFNGTTHSSGGSASIRITVDCEQTGPHWWDITWTVTVHWTIQSLASYSPSPSSGTITTLPENGTLAIGITFTPVSVTTYTVTFTESGLAPGTSWSVMFNGTTETQVAGLTIVFSGIANATYGFTANATGYTAYPESGSVVVNGADATQAIVFTAVAPGSYSVTFTETGLAPGISWSVTLHGATESSPTSSIVFTEPNGSYSFSVGAVSGYTASPASGTVIVAGIAVSEAITFTSTSPPTGNQYPVTVTETGLPSNTGWYVGGSPSTPPFFLAEVVQTGAVIEFTLPNGTYDLAAGSSNTNYTASPSSFTVTVNGAVVSESVTFSTGPPPSGYAVTFTETGLPSGHSWSVFFNSSSKSSTTSTITFYAPSGTSSFYVSSQGYSASPEYGTVTVSGGPVTQAITFTVETQYAVTFTETGLPGGTSWYVSLNGATASSTGTSITFMEPNGGYSFTVGAVTGYLASPSSGTVSVNGAPVTEAITFGPLPAGSYSVTFTESGLPTYYPWFAVLGNLTNSADGNGSAPAVLTVTNGSYGWSVYTYGYLASPSTGLVTIHGASVTVSVTFSALASGMYEVVFEPFSSTQSISNSAAWSLTLGGQVHAVAGEVLLALAEPTGNYAWTISAPTGSAAVPGGGTLQITGGVSFGGVSIRLGAEVLFSFLPTAPLAALPLAHAPLSGLMLDASRWLV